MKKAWLAGTKQQRATFKSLDYLYDQFADIGAEPDSSVTGFHDTIKILHVVGVIDDNTLSVGTDGDKLNTHC